MKPYVDSGLTRHDRKITDKQIAYINGLSDPVKKDEKYYGYDIKIDNPNLLKEYLTKKNKALDKLTIREGSELIGALQSNRLINFTFPCGITEWIDPEVSGRSYIMGKLDGCIHFCPDKKVSGDVNSCPYWKKIYNAKSWKGFDEIEEKYIEELKKE